MVTQDQSEVFAFLASPLTHGGAPVERVDTHASVVFLAGARAFKVKRAVRYDYLDFSTPERRRAMCEAEVRINRRTAPSLYLGVVPITRGRDGGLALGGAGTPVDWAVEMVRFDQELLFDRLAAREALPVDSMRPLAVAVARFHADAHRRFDHGGQSGMRWVIDGNETDLRALGAGTVDPLAIDRVTRASRCLLGAHEALLDARRAAGLVRQCHGDLHLGNLVLLDGRPTLFDAVEFNDEIACIDVLYDLAFLLMDLWRRGLFEHANALWNAYLAESRDLEGLPLIPLFLSCRAAIRAKTTLAALSLERDRERRRTLADTAQDYMWMAERTVRTPAPRLIALGGYSGSGKSTVAARIAPLLGAIPGAVVIRSDEVRKQLCGAPPLGRLGPAGYSPEMSRRVYATVAMRAAAVVKSGYTAVVDAVCARAADREALARTALAAAVPFIGMWLDAPEAVLVDRVAGRRDDVSDADVAVVRAQLQQEIGALAWTRIDASRPASVVARDVQLRLSVPGGDESGETRDCAPLVTAPVPA